MRQNTPSYIEPCFFSPTHGWGSLEDVVRIILHEYHTYPDAHFQPIVGTDSESVNSSAKFVTVIVLWRVGRGAKGFRMVTNEASLGGSESYKVEARIRREIFLTAILAQELRSNLRDALGDDPERVQVHADVGPNGRTSRMMQEVIGTFKAYGIPEEAIFVKPEAFVASTVADRYI